MQAFNETVIHYSMRCTIRTPDIPLSFLMYKYTPMIITTIVTQTTTPAVLPAITATLSSSFSLPPSEN